MIIKPTTCRAFTLIELLVVIAILAAMLLPALASAKERARRTAQELFDAQYQITTPENTGALPD